MISIMEEHNILTVKGSNDEMEEFYQFAKEVGAIRHVQTPAVWSHNGELLMGPKAIYKFPDKEITALALLMYSW